MGIVGYMGVLKQTDFLRALTHLHKDGFFLMMRDCRSPSTSIVSCGQKDCHFISDKVFNSANPETLSKGQRSLDANLWYSWQIIITQILKKLTTTVFETAPMSRFQSNFSMHQLSAPD